MFRWSNILTMQKIRNVEKPVLYAENQKYRQTWIWVMILIPVFISIHTLIFLFLPEYRTGDTPAPDFAFRLILIAFGIALPLFFGFTDLQTKITCDGIHVRYIPFHRKWRFIPTGEIETFEKVTYRPVLEYGGWGIRFGLRGMAYSVSGKDGIRITFKNGKKLLIGTRKPDDFEQSLAVIIPRKEKTG